MSEGNRVLLTGVSGFLGSHTTIQLLNRGYRVTGTLRDMKRAKSLRSVLARHTDRIDNLTFAEADLLDSNVWRELARDVTFVQHIASPFPQTLPKDERELIVPARDGTLNVLRAAAHHGVKRVVVTSSSGAVMYGKQKGQRSRSFNENDWTDETNKSDTTPYYRSKTIAEKAAWKFYNNGSNGLELTVVCPGTILGPLLENDFAASANIVIKTMDGTSPALPRIAHDFTDVRSIAELLILAMEREEAAGERFVGSAGLLTFREVADIIRNKFPERRIPKRTLPDFATRLVARFEPSLKPILIDLGKKRRLDCTKARVLLDWKPLPPEDAVIACAESIVEHNVIAAAS